MAASNGTRMAILGAGNIGAAIARGLVAAGIAPAGEITLTRRKKESLAALASEGFDVTTDNARAVRGSGLIFLAVTPQQLNALLKEIRTSVDPARHTVVSIVSGVTIAEIRNHLGGEVVVIRAMPNTAIAIRQSMTCLSTDRDGRGALALVGRIFDSLGRTLVVDEGLMIPATALCACGIAFFLRAIRAASQGGIEIGFHAGDALLMAAQTARGAASLLVEGGNHPEGEVDRVTTPQGCTITGLNQMEHHGFSSALIRGIVTSAEKAAVLYAPRQDLPGRAD
ncbi:MAG TPA: pyrroline-5-carboxylate reductase [Bacteroidota bacterium]|nr:pyrroline-5-carboxylate reductase [Bacteroidota bacterium]